MASDNKKLGKIVEVIGPVVDVQFEEGLGWDTDVPANFRVGLSNGSGARPNQNLNVFEKAYDQTMRERAHVGSAAWVEAPDHLRAFADGTADDRGGEGGERTYAHELRDGGHYSRPSPARVDG